MGKTACMTPFVLGQFPQTAPEGQVVTGLLVKPYWSPGLHV